MKPRLILPVAALLFAATGVAAGVRADGDANPGGNHRTEHGSHPSSGHGPDYGPHPGSGHGPDYGGQQQRAIKSLSEDDIAQLQQGKGWGMAKPAELNGYPGPSHALALAAEIGLSEAQQVALAQLFQTMQAQAIAAGQRFIASEQALEQAFRQRRVAPESLRALLAASAEARAQLRYVHLDAHLTTAVLLSPQQRALYNQRRGYHSGAGIIIPIEPLS